jgi:hypothetical protein
VHQGLARYARFMTTTLLFGLLIACGTTPAPADKPTKKEVVDAKWEGIPLQRGTWPAWSKKGADSSEVVSTRGDGTRFAFRLLLPPLDRDGGSASHGNVRDVWTSRVDTPDGGERVLTVTLKGEVEQISGTPIQLSPNGASFIGMVVGGPVEGVIDFGHQSFAVTCAGPGVSLEPDGWCVQAWSSAWLETWEG